MPFGAMTHKQCQFIIFIPIHNRYLTRGKLAYSRAIVHSLDLPGLLGLVESANYSRLTMPQLSFVCIILIKLPDIDKYFPKPNNGPPPRTFTVSVRRTCIL